MHAMKLNGESRRTVQSSLASILEGGEMLSSRPPTFLAVKKPGVH